MYLHSPLLISLVMFPARRLVLIPLRYPRPRCQITRLRRSTTLRCLRSFATACAASPLRWLASGAHAPFYQPHNKPDFHPFYT